MSKVIKSGALSIIRISLGIIAALALLPCRPLAQTSVVTESAESVLRRVFQDHYSGQASVLKSLVRGGEIDAFGLSGTFTARFLAPDKQDLSLDFGVAEFDMGYDGQTGWMIDQNGSLLELSGSELEAMVNEVYLAGRSFLLDGGYAGVREYLGPLSYSGRGCHEFRFFPPGGSEIEVIIDSLNGAVLLSRTEIDDIKEVTIYSDFRAVDGFVFPFRIQTTASVEQLNTSVRVTECRVNVKLDSLSFSRGAAAFDDVLFPFETDSVVVPLERSGGLLFVMVRVNGSAPLRFLLDSGAGANIIARSAADSLGLAVVGEIPVKGIAGYESAGYVQISSLAIGDVELVEQTIGAIELPPDITNSVGEISGALGYDFFSRLVVTIDFGAPQMIMYRPAFFNARADQIKKEGVYEFPLEFSGKIPHIDAKLGGTVGKFIVDLGNNLGIIVHHSFAEGLDALSPPPGATEIGRAAGVGGIINLVAFELPEFSLGPLRMHNVPAVILAEGQGLSATRKIAGNIGLSFWKDYLLTLDYSSRRLFLSPRR